MKTFDEFRYFTGVTALDTNFLNGCTSLTSITIPANVESISYETLAQDSPLTTITLLTTDADHILMNNMYDFSLPDTVTAIYVPASMIEVYEHHTISKIWKWRCLRSIR